MKKTLLTIICAVATLTATALELQDFVLAQSRPLGISEFSPAKSSGAHYYRMEGNTINRYAFKKEGNPVAVFSRDTLPGGTPVQWDGYEMACNDLLILLWCNKENIYRHSFRADFYVYDTRRHTLTPLSDGGGEEIATISPTGTHIAWAKDNNIFVKNLENGTVTTVTTDGKKNEIINGVPDWVYQEEFGILNSLRWSPGGDTLAFLRWDESRVPMCSMQLYEGECSPRKEYALHPGSFDYKYPAAGETNSTVTAHTFSLATGALATVELPQGEGYYIPSIDFSPAGDLMVNTLNRAQNHFAIHRITPQGETSCIYNDRSDIWINNYVVTGVQFLDDFIAVMSNRDGRNHLYALSYSGQNLRQLTAGDYDVTALYGYDARRRTFYVQTTNGPTNRIVRSVQPGGVVRNITGTSGTFSATFNSDYTLYIRSYSDATTPTQYSIVTTAGDVVRHLELNEEYAATYTAPQVPKREFFTLNSHGYTLNGYLMRPVDFDPLKKYPVIVTQYNGPGSQEVLNKWQLDWQQFFAMHGYVIACLDTRGTGAQGKEFMKTVYLNLGKCETEDIIALAHHLADQPWVDAARMGIYGWSYGGFMSLMAMSQPGSPFAAGVSIAPVTSWKFYDTIYSERYMLTPQENPEGYANAPLDLAEHLSGDLLLMFGSADDNVRIVNSMQYLSRLIALNKAPQLLVFPNMNHSINGCDTRLTLYTRMLQFFDERLGVNQ